MSKIIALPAFILTAGLMESIDYWWDMINWKLVFLLIAFLAVIIYLKRKQLNSD